MKVNNVKWNSGQSYNYCSECGGIKTATSKFCRKCHISHSRPPIDDDVYIINNERCRKIPLNGGLYAVVDEIAYADLIKFNWTATRHRNTHYVSRKIKLGLNQWDTIHLHKFIYGTGNDGPQIDHKNRNGLDNRISNLRECTDAQNRANQKIRKDNRTGYKGVGICVGSKNFRAYVTINGKLKHLGCFYNVEDAARAYDKAAQEHYGEFANVNFPEGSLWQQQDLNQTRLR